MYKSCLHSRSFQWKCSNDDISKIMTVLHRDRINCQTYLSRTYPKSDDTRRIFEQIRRKTLYNSKIDSTWLFVNLYSKVGLIVNQVRSFVQYLRTFSMKLFAESSNETYTHPCYTDTKPMTADHTLAHSCANTQTLPHFHTPTPTHTHTQEYWPARAWVWFE